MKYQKFSASWILALSAVWILVAEALADSEPDSFDLLGEFPTSELATRIKPYQFRASMIYGSLSFASRRAASNSNIALDGVQAGARLELERWFRAGKANRRSLGVIADFQFLYVGQFKALPGDPIHYTSGSLMLGWRALGFGHTVPWKPELTLFLGPSLEVFPAMTAYVLENGNYVYTLEHPTVLGAKSGARLRVPLLSYYLAAEATGYYILPIKTLGTAAGATLSRENTQSYGATAILDLRLARGVVLGGGFYWGFFKLGYKPATTSNSDETRFYTRAFLGSIRLSF